MQLKSFGFEYALGPLFPAPLTGVSVQFSSQRLPQCPQHLWYSSGRPKHLVTLKRATCHLYQAHSGVKSLIGRHTCFPSSPLAGGGGSIRHFVVLDRSFAQYPRVSYRIASSNTLFRFRCVNAEHSRYFWAFISFATWTACSY